MKSPYFNDPNVPPTDDSILEAIGRAKGAWQKLFARIRTEHPDLSETWKFYKDGKSWLCQVTWKKKTVFWILIMKGRFRVGFYFAKRLMDQILESDLSKERKEEIQKKPAKGQIGSVAVEFGPQKGIKDVMILIDLKKTLK